LTSEGQALLQYCKGAVELEGAVFSKLSGDMANAEIHLTVAGTTSIMTSRIATAAAAMLKSNPNLYLHLLIDDDSNLVDLVRMDRAQPAAVSPAQVPLEVDSKRLKPDRYLLVGPARWRGRQLTDILTVERIIDFYESDKTTLNYLRKFDLEKYLKRSRLFVNDNGALVKLFTEGVGFGTLEQNVAKPFLDSGKLVALNKGQFLEDQVALIWYPRPQMPAYFGEFIGAIK
jgi:LysR family transcriptional regulator, chromosome initiation inhibitor